MQKPIDQKQDASAALSAHVDPQVLTLANIAPETLRVLRTDLKLDEAQISEIFEAVQGGVRTPAEFLGVTEPIANTIEEMALTFYRDRHYTHATTLYQFLTDVCPKRSSAWRGIGACMQALKVYAAAVLCYYEALDRNPEDPVSLVLLGESLVLQGLVHEGMRALERGVAKAGENPLYAIYVKRANGALATQREALNLQKKNDALGRETPKAGQAPDADGRAEKFSAEQVAEQPIDLESVDVDALVALDDDAFRQHPAVQQVQKALSGALRQNAITIKDVAGFTDAQLYGLYAAACHQIDVGQPLTAMTTAAWLLFYDQRNPKYLQLAGIATQHAKLYCLADYLYTLSLIYDKDNATSMLYSGECKIYSFERNKGMALVRKALVLLERDPKAGEQVQRANALIRQFEKKPNNQRAPASVGKK